MLIDDTKKYIESSYAKKKNQFEPLIEEDEFCNSSKLTLIT
jgi:hypothetical protein